MFWNYVVFIFLCIASLIVVLASIYLIVDTVKNIIAYRKFMKKLSKGVKMKNEVEKILRANYLEPIVATSEILQLFNEKIDSCKHDIADVILLAGDRVEPLAQDIIKLIKETINE